MLVLIGPPFGGTDEEYGRLAQATGLLPYDLRTKLKPDAWGVVRAIGNRGEADELARNLGGQGFRVAVVDASVAADPDRVFVPLKALEVRESDLVLHLSERSMPIPHRALLAIVRGEVQVGGRSGSSAAFRAVVPGVGGDVLREASAMQVDAFAAADLHFATVQWAARIDARAFDFSILGDAAGGAQDLDRLVDYLAATTGVRVDRAHRISSVASFTGGVGPTRAATPMPGRAGVPRREVPERFDAYSRLIAEAERLAPRHARPSTRPPPAQ